MPEPGAVADQMRCQRGTGVTYQPHWLDRTQVRVDAAKDEIRRMVASAKYRVAMMGIEAQVDTSHRQMSGHIRRLLGAIDERPRKTGVECSFRRPWWNW